jgi:translocator protein
MNKKTLSLILCYLPAVLIQVVSSIATVSSMGSWYSSLLKAPWSPPKWVFGPAWTLIYILISIALWLIYQSPHKHKKAAYLLFALQLILNALWSILFFVLHLPGIAFLELLLLFGIIIATGLTFYKIRPSAGLLLIPYLIWVLYALTLNGAIIYLN